MKPANQNNIVKASAARMPNLCAATGKRFGARTRYMTARIVQTLQKRRKLAWEGDQFQDQSLTTRWEVKVSRYHLDVGRVVEAYQMP
jgi:hypothetical protein